jgi:pentapeptide MXKDX repeat protein
MRNLLIVACCAALVGSVSVAGAQTTGPTSQDSMKTNSPMDANAKAKKKSAKKSTKSDDSMKSDAPKDGMKDMSKDGMKKDSK